MTEQRTKHESFRIIHPIIAETLFMSIQDVFGSKYVWLSWCRLLVIFLSPSRQVSSVGDSHSAM